MHPTQDSPTVTCWPCCPLSLWRAPCRIDCFSELASSAFGDKMKEQVEDRLRFYEEGVAPKKNITAMQVCVCALHLGQAYCLRSAQSGRWAPSGKPGWLMFWNRGLPVRT